MGATVVKVEPPPRVDDTRLWGPPFVNGISSYFLSINRNKRSIGLNLKSPEGKEVLWKLIDRADVLVENFRPGVLEKLGFGYEAVSSRNPRIIYASISGYGQTGPYRDRPYDVVAQGESGIVDLTGEPDRQPVMAHRSPVVAGLYASGILLAMLARHRTARTARRRAPRWNDLTLTYQAMSHPRPVDRRSASARGTRQSCRTKPATKDGSVNIGAANRNSGRTSAARSASLTLPSMNASTRWRGASLTTRSCAPDAELRKMTRAERSSCSRSSSCPSVRSTRSPRC
jgi:hypothetical protein